MNAVYSFHLVTQSSFDPYNLHPAPWQTMSPKHTHRAVTIFQENNSRWGVSCIMSLKDEVLVSLKEIPRLQVAIWHAIKTPLHLERGIEDPEIKIAPELSPEVIRIEGTCEKGHDGLTMFQLKPNILKGKELYDHMVGFHLSDYETKPTKHKISDSLGMCTPMKGYRNEQKDLFRFDYQHVLEASIMDKGRGDGQFIYAARSKLGNVGAIKSQCCIFNAQECMEKFVEKVEAVASVGDIQLNQKRLKDKSSAMKIAELRPIVASTASYTSKEGWQERRVAGAV